MSTAVNSNGPAKVDALRRRLGFWLRNDAARLLWPARCLACGEGAAEAIDLCPDCLAGLPWLGAACPRCALPLPSPPGHADAPPEACGACLSQPPPLRRAHAACLYASPLDRLLPRFKFHHDLAAGRLLAQLMAEGCAALPRPDVLVPVPLHPGRLRLRGYDQALELARPLARALDLPLCPGLLRRVRATAPQSRLDGAARRRNLGKAFAVPAAAGDGADAMPAHVALVDDVMTTGATLHAAARALRRAGVRRVDAWVAARTP